MIQINRISRKRANWNILIELIDILSGMEYNNYNQVIIIITKIPRRTLMSKKGIVLSTINGRKTVTGLGYYNTDDVSDF